MHFVQTKGEEGEVLSIKIVKQLNQLTGYSHEHMPKRVLWSVTPPSPSLSI